MLRVNPKLATIHKYYDASAANLMLEAIVANFPHLTYSILESDDIEDNRYGICRFDTNIKQQYYLSQRNR